MATVLVSPILPAPPLYTPPGKYPTSPIITSPLTSPILGAAPRKLRERCGVSMSLGFNSAYMNHTQPHRTNLPRRRNGAKRLFALEKHEEQPVVEKKREEVELVIDLNEKSTPVLPIAPKEPESHIQELIPGLSVAFSDGHLSAPQPGDSAEKPYTHVVNITYPLSPREHKGGCSKSLVGRTQRLHITLPSTTRVQGRPGLGLTDGNLRAIRDFVGEAFPHSMASSANDDSPIRVLITTPHGRPTDAMCAVGCYLAFVSGQSVESVLSYIDEAEDFLSIWKAEVSGDEMERAEKIARAWSWLSTIACAPPTHS